MPTYEYECLKCGGHFELFQKITDEPRKRCPDCRGAVRRKIGAGAGLLFKGSGFYSTDYRSESYKKGMEADKKQGDSATKTGDGAAKKGDASSKKKNQAS